VRGFTLPGAVHIIGGSKEIGEEKRQRLENVPFYLYRKKEEENEERRKEKSRSPGVTVLDEPEKRKEGGERMGLAEGRPVWCARGGGGGKKKGGG